jgi:hypothetical protein
MKALEDDLGTWASSSCDDDHLLPASQVDPKGICGHIHVYRLPITNDHLNRSASSQQHHCSVDATGFINGRSKLERITKFSGRHFEVEDETAALEKVSSKGSFGCRIRNNSPPNRILSSQKSNGTTGIHNRTGDQSVRAGRKRAEGRGGDETRKDEVRTCL